MKQYLNHFLNIVNLDVFIITQNATVADSVIKITM